MRFKYMIFSIIILALTIALVLTGCSDSNSVSNNISDVPNRRLQRAEGNYDYAIGYDVITKVCYLFGHHCVTVMVDEEGKPLLYDKSDFSN